MEVYQVLVETDDENRVHYTEDVAFEEGSEEARSAFREYTALVMASNMLGYRIVKREKAIDPEDEERTESAGRLR